MATRRTIKSDSGEAIVTRFYGGHVRGTCIQVYIPEGASFNKLQARELADTIRKLNGDDPVWGVCSGCENDIDLTTCGCGSPKEGHDPMEMGHSFVPLGCDCFRD